MRYLTFIGQTGGHVPLDSMTFSNVNSVLISGYVQT
jgi:hypothetical protein